MSRALSMAKGWSIGLQPLLSSVLHSPVRKMEGKAYTVPDTTLQGIT